MSTIGKLALKCVLCTKVTSIVSSIQSVLFVRSTVFGTQPHPSNGTYVPREEGVLIDVGGFEARVLQEGEEKRPVPLQVVLGLQHHRVLDKIGHGSFIQLLGG